MSDNKYADAFKDEEEDEDNGDTISLDGFVYCPNCKTHIPVTEMESHFCEESILEDEEDDSDNTDGDGEEVANYGTDACAKCGNVFPVKSDGQTICDGCFTSLPTHELFPPLPLSKAQIAAKKKKENQVNLEIVAGKEYDEFSNHITIQRWQYVKLPPIARTAILSVIRLSLAYRKSVERWLAKDASTVNDARVFTMPYVCSGFVKDDAGHVVPKSMKADKEDDFEDEDNPQSIDAVRTLPDHAHFCVLSKEGDPASHISASAEFYKSEQRKGGGKMEVVLHGPLAKVTIKPEWGCYLFFAVDPHDHSLTVTQMDEDSATYQNLHDED